MFKLLQSIFGGEKQGEYPEALVNMAIERAVDGTDPSIRAVSGYKKKLRPAVVRAIDHVVAMVDALPPPMPVHFASTAGERPLKGYFISAREMLEVFRGDRALAEFMKQGGGSPGAIALLAMEKQEKVTFGAALSGDVVIHDVPMVTVSFDAHRLMDPTANEQETRRCLKRRAFDHLLSLALRQLVLAKDERKDLERHRTLLQAKLNLLQREGWGFDAAAAKSNMAEAEERLGQLEAQLQELGGEYGENEAYLHIVADVLANPEQYFLSTSETLFVNQVGVKQSGAASDVHELSFTELYNIEGRRLVAMLVALDAEELRRLSADSVQ
jgi:hypothetical protein